MTYLDTDIGLDISTTVGLELNGTNEATDYRSGNAFHADLAITKNLTKSFSVSALIGHYQQFSSDGGSGNNVGPHKGRVTAVGGAIGYSFEAGGIPVTARLKIMREVSVENRTQGTIGLLSIAIPLGGQTPPSAKPIVAKH